MAGSAGVTSTPGMVGRKWLNSTLPVAYQAVIAPLHRVCGIAVGSPVGAGAGAGAGAGGGGAGAGVGASSPHATSNGTMISSAPTSNHNTGFLFTTSLLIIHYKTLCY